MPDGKVLVLELVHFFAGILKPEVTFSFINVLSSRNLGTVIYFLSNLTLDFTYNTPFKGLTNYCQFVMTPFPKCVVAILKK